MLSLVFLYVFNFGLLVFMSFVNYIIEKKKILPHRKFHKCSFAERKNLFHIHPSGGGGGHYETQSLIISL